MPLCCGASPIRQRDDLERFLTHGFWYRLSVQTKVPMVTSGSP